jgi:hypothetical protein
VIPIVFGKVRLGTSVTILKDATDQRPFRDALTGLGFTVRTKPLRELGEGDQRQFGR